MEAGRYSVFIRICEESKDASVSESAVVAEHLVGDENDGACCGRVRIAARRSEHYPNVTADGEQMSVEQALETIRDIVDEQLMAERVQIMSDEMDTLSAIYLTYVLGRGDTVSYNALNKDLRTRGVDVSELVNEGLLEQDGDQLRILSPEARADRIEGKRDPLAVDEAHYLKYLFETDQLAQKFGKWTTEGSIAALRRLAEIENDEDYADIADYVEERSDTQLDLQDFS